MNLDFALGELLMLRILAMTVVGIGVVSCFADNPKDATEPVSQVNPDVGTSVAEPAPKTPVMDIQPMPLPPDPCKIFAKIPGEPPAFILDHGVMITRFMKPCVTRSGERGYESDTPWIAMGFPCTAGGGKIQVTGYQSEPKMVSFPLSTDCPMSPASAGDVDIAVKTVTDLTPEAKIMAYYPFVVQYWEIPDFEDAEVGFTIDLVSTRARSSLWQAFRQRDEPIAIRLYGRENAWVQGDQLYEVEALLKRTGVTSFQLQVTNAKGLTREEVETVKDRCFSLSPRRNCASAF